MFRGSHHFALSQSHQYVRYNRTWVNWARRPETLVDSADAPSGSWAICPTRGSCRSSRRWPAARASCRCIAPAIFPTGRSTPIQPPALVVIHRQRLTATDAQRLKEYRVSSAAGGPPAIVLCISPYVRYAELERWSSLADLVISEATAPDILPCHVTRRFGDRKGGGDRPTQSGLCIEVAGGNHDLCQAVVDACSAAGYRAHAVPDLERAGGPAWARAASRTVEPERKLTIWDVPVLEPDWSQRLERRTRSTGPVIRALGFRRPRDRHARESVRCRRLSRSALSRR